jgi:hypothetical protein
LYEFEEGNLREPQYKYLLDILEGPADKERESETATPEDLLQMLDDGWEFPGFARDVPGSSLSDTPNDK